MRTLTKGSYVSGKKRSEVREVLKGYDTGKLEGLWGLELI